MDYLDVGVSASESPARLLSSRRSATPQPLGLALGLRLLALAVVAGSGAFLPVASGTHLRLVAGILGGAVLGVGQHATARWRLPVVGEVFVLAEVAVWTYLLHVTGGQRSSLFVGYLLEIPLAAVFLSRRGIVLAAAAAAVAYVGTSMYLEPTLNHSTAAVAIGFLAVTAVLSWLLMEVLDRQQAQIAASHAALTTRAKDLAEELRLLGDYLDDALVGLDEMGRVVSINQSGLDLLGLERAAALGPSWQEVLHPNAEGTRVVACTLADGQARRATGMLLGRPGRPPVAVEADVWMSPSAEGRRTYLLLGAPRGEPSDGDPLRRLGEAVACVSHQIKNSFHALHGFACRIQQELDPGAARSESTHQFLKALNSLGELADDVLAMSGAPRSASETIPIGDILSSAVVLARHAETRVSVGAPRLLVSGHRGQLVHALFNLVDNACRVSPAGSTVQVHAFEANGHVQVEIRDAGPGLPVGLDPGAARAPSQRGSGYGLLAARRFIETNGGQIAFERIVEGGTVCRVSLVKGVVRGG